MDVKSQALSQEDFLKILVPKLEAVKKEQDRNELLNKKLLEVKRITVHCEATRTKKTKFFHQG
jgi:hypothetical protein